MSTTKTSRAASATGQIATHEPDITGLTEFAVQEMREKLKEERRKSTKGWNEQAVAEHNRKLQETAARIEAFEKSQRGAARS